MDESIKVSIPGGKSYAPEDKSLIKRGNNLYRDLILASLAYFEFLEIRDVKDKMEFSRRKRNPTLMMPIRACSSFTCKQTPSHICDERLPQHVQNRSLYLK